MRPSSSRRKFNPKPPPPRRNPETGTTTQADGLIKAGINLREATELYLKEFSFEPTDKKPFVTTFEVAYA